MGTVELIVVAVVILIFFGAGKLKELARGLGESTKEIKKVKKEYHDSVKSEIDGLKN